MQSAATSNEKIFYKGFSYQGDKPFFHKVIPRFFLFAYLRAALAREIVSEYREPLLQMRRYSCKVLVIREIKQFSLSFSCVFLFAYLRAALAREIVSA